MALLVKLLGAFQGYYSKTSEIRLSKNKPKCIIFGRYLIWEVLPVAAKFKDPHQIQGLIKSKGKNE